MGVKEISAGIIPYRECEGEREYLLLLYPGGHWSFPKGHLESGEDFEETALRELEEETSISPDRVLLDEEFKYKFKYKYTRDDQLMDKTVHYFAGKVPSDVEVSLSFEHEDYRWLAYQEAKEKITYQNATEMLEEFHNQKKHKLH
jgi:8-oxo-dGTP pyrophosphatase MutT (NUDIX family)